MKTMSDPREPSPFAWTDVSAADLAALLLAEESHPLHVEIARRLREQAAQLAAVERPLAEIEKCAAYWHNSKYESDKAVIYTDRIRQAVRDIRRELHPPKETPDHE